MSGKKVGWVLSNGIIGMDNQSLGLAAALGLDVTKKHLVPVAPWRYLPPQLWLKPLRFLGKGSDALTPPWPDVVISTGRLTAAAALAIKRASGGKVFNIRIQSAYTAYDEFDVIVTPRHDQFEHPNGIQTIGSMHSLTHQRLAEAGEKFAAKFAHLPRPLVGVTVGGSNACYKITPEIGRQLGEQLAKTSAETGAGILLTPSRRTGAEVEAALRQALANTPCYIWDGKGDNPYLGLLALSDYLVTTADSVNMVAEACFTGKPVYVVQLKGGSQKFLRFHDTLRKGGYTRPFTGELENWIYPPLDEVSDVARQILERMNPVS
jgi:hypothetical protein